jgi:hypothetical protein
MRKLLECGRRVKRISVAYPTRSAFQDEMQETIKPLQDEAALRIDEYKGVLGFPTNHFYRYHFFRGLPVVGGVYRVAEVVTSDWIPHDRSPVECS